MFEHFLEKSQENGLLAGKMTRLKEPNSKHWFTTFFLQPLPYLIDDDELMLNVLRCQLTY